MQSSALQWFIRTIDTFAPPAQRAARHQLYTDLAALQPTSGTDQQVPLCLFVLSQIVAASRLTRPPASSKAAGRADAHATWYEKERQRVTKMLAQIAESPVVASFQSTLEYYQAHEVTCVHGRNQKTCEELYALRLTLQFLEQSQVARLVKKAVEKLRQQEPHLPLLAELCAPAPLDGDTDSNAVLPAAPAGRGAAPEQPDECTAYLLGTVVSYLRQLGLTVAQSCCVVDRALHVCFGIADPHGTRPALLADQWRRLRQAGAGG